VTQQPDDPTDQPDRATEQPAAAPARLPDGCDADGRVTGTRAVLLVDPGPALGSARTSEVPVHVVCTDAAALAALAGQRPDAGGTLFVHASVPVEPDEPSTPAETVHGWPVRRVHTAATTDLGGLVVDVVHVGAAHGPDNLVVAVRAVDERGRPRRDVPPVVYTGLMVNDTALADPDDPITDELTRTHEQMRAWADSLDLVCGLLGGEGLAVTQAGTIHPQAQVDAQRVARLQAAGSSGTGRVGMPPPDWQLPLA